MDLKLCEFYVTFLKKCFKHEPETIQKFQNLLIPQRDVACNQDETNDRNKKRLSCREIEKLAYIYQQNLCTSSAVAFLFEELLKKNISLLRKFLKQSVVNICCFSDGSCAEIVSLLEILTNKSKDTANSFFIHVTVVCPDESWKSISKKVFEYLGNNYPLQKKFEFIAVDLSEEVSDIVVDVIESADILTMVKFLSEIKNCPRKFHAVYQDILKYVSPGAVVLFLDHAYRNLFPSINRHLLTYELLHYKISYLHAVHLRAVEKIFRLYHLHLKDALCVTCMQISFGAWLNVGGFTLSRKIFNSIGDRRLIVKTDKVNRKDNKVFLYERPTKTERNETVKLPPKRIRHFKTKNTVVEKKKEKAIVEICPDKISYCYEYARGVEVFLKTFSLKNISGFIPPIFRFSNKMCSAANHKLLSTLKAEATEEVYLTNLKIFLSVSSKRFDQDILNDFFTKNHNTFRLLRQKYWLSRVESYEVLPSDKNELAELIVEGEGLAVLKEITEMNRKLLTSTLYLIRCGLDKYEVDYINLFVDKVSEFLEESNVEHEFVLPLFVDHPNFSDFCTINEKHFRTGSYHKTLDFFRLFLSTDIKPFRTDNEKCHFTENHNKVRLKCEKLWLEMAKEFQKRYPPYYKLKKIRAYYLVKLIAQGKGLAVLKAFVEDLSFDKRLKLIEERKLSVDMNFSRSKGLLHPKCKDEIDIDKLLESKDVWQVTLNRDMKIFRNIQLGKNNLDEQGKVSNTIKEKDYEQQPSSDKNEKPHSISDTNKVEHYEQSSNKNKKPQTISNAFLSLDAMQKVKDANEDENLVPKPMSKKQMKLLRKKMIDEKNRARKEKKKKRQERFEARMAERKRQKEILKCFEEKYSEKMEKEKKIAAEKRKNHMKSLYVLRKQLAKEQVEIEDNFDAEFHESDFDIPYSSFCENIFMQDIDYCMPCVNTLNQNKSKSKRWQISMEK